jgi:hypothetical protein
METKTKQYVQVLFEGAKNAGEVERYVKFQNIDARPAKEGEKIVTNIGKEKETENAAKKGDFVIRAKTKNKEEYIISGDKFHKRYIPAENKEEDKDGFKEYTPIGDCYAFEYKGGSFKFEAPWGDDMIIHDGDFLASTGMDKPDDIYRIARNEFHETYKKEKA